MTPDSRTSWSPPRQVETFLSAPLPESGYPNSYPPRHAPSPLFPLNYPSRIDLCSRRSGAADIDLSTWRVAGIGGDMIRPHILENFAERFASQGFDARAFVASYGMAEATLAISFAPLNVGLRTDTIDRRRYLRLHQSFRYD